jgi:hypothetical protein
MKLDCVAPKRRAKCQFLRHRLQPESEFLLQSLGIAAPLSLSKSMFTTQLNFSRVAAEDLNSNGRRMPGKRLMRNPHN